MDVTTRATYAFIGILFASLAVFFLINLVQWFPSWDIRVSGLIGITIAMFAWLAGCLIRDAVKQEV